MIHKRPSRFGIKNIKFPFEDINVSPVKDPLNCAARLKPALIGLNLPI